jgi:hypothetical protein
VAQAVTVHWAAWPRSLLACARTTFRQRLTGAAGEPVPVALAVGVGVAVAVGVALEEVAAVREAVSVGDAVPVDEALSVGSDVAVPDALGVADGLAVGVAVGADVVGAGVVGAGVVGAAGDVGLVVCVGDELGCGAGRATASHDSPVPAVTAPVAAEAVAAAAMPNPEAAVTRTPPATRAAAVGRTCAKRMRTPSRCCRTRYYFGTTLSMEWLLEALFA